MNKKEGEEEKEGVVRKTFGGGKRLCPKFKGVEGEDYELWRKKVKVWFIAERKRLECPAAVLLLSLGDKVYSEVCDIGEKEMVGEKGFLKLLNIFYDRFGKDQGRDKNDKLQNFFEIKR